MKNAVISIVENVSSDQAVNLVGICFTGFVVLALAFGAYEKGYTLQGSYHGISITLSPQKDSSEKC